MAQLLEPCPTYARQTLAIEEKSFCGTLQSDAAQVHLAALFDQRTRRVLSQEDVSDKTNEHKTTVELLRTMVLNNHVVTDDAAFCQRNVFQQIIDRGGD